MHIEDYRERLLRSSKHHPFHPWLHLSLALLYDEIKFSDPQETNDCTIQDHSSSLFGSNTNPSTLSQHQYLPLHCQTGRDVGGF